MNERTIAAALAIMVVVSSIPAIPISFVGTATAQEVENNTTKNFLVYGDTHMGDSLHNYAPPNDHARQWVVNREIDYIFHIGDLTEDSSPNHWRQARQNLTTFVNETPANGYWYTTGASHDGFNTKASPHSNNESDRGINSLGQMRRDNHSSMLYSVEMGNTVFITVPTYHYGNGEDEFISRAWKDWLKNQLKYYDENGYNIVFYTHQPFNNTTHYTKPGDWYGMDHQDWQETSRDMKNILERYGVDVVLTAHIHSDPDIHYTAQGTKSGKIVNGSNFSDLPNMTFVSSANIAYEHGFASGDGNSNYPATYLWNFTEGEDHIVIRAYDVRNDTEVDIAYGNTSGQTTKGLKVKLDNKIEFGPHSSKSNTIDNYRQGWMPSDIPDMMNSSREDFYVMGQGFKVKKSDYWWNSTWQHHHKEVVPASVEVNKSNGTLSHEFYASENNQDYRKYNGEPTEWVKVKTDVEEKSSDHFFVYNYSLERAIVFEDIDAELKNGTYVVRETSYDPKVEILRNASHMNFSRNKSLNYTVGSAAEPRFVETNLNVSPKSGKVNVSFNNVSDSEVENFTAQKPQGNVTFRIQNLNESHNYTVYRDGEVMVENRTLNNTTTLVFHNENWSEHTFSVVDTGPAQSGDGTEDGLILTSEACDIDVFGFSVTCTELRSIGLGLGISVVGVGIYLIYRRRETFFAG